MSYTNVINSAYNIVQHNGKDFTLFYYAQLRCFAQIAFHYTNAVVNITIPELCMDAHRP